MDTEIMIGFNRTTGKFNFLEKKPNDNCWWPTSKEFPTLPEAEAALVSLQQSKAVQDSWERHYNSDANVSYVATLPAGARPVDDNCVMMFMELGTVVVHSDGTIWIEFTD